MSEFPYVEYAEIRKRSGPIGPIDSGELDGMSTSGVRAVYVAINSGRRTYEVEIRRVGDSRKHYTTWEAIPTDPDAAESWPSLQPQTSPAEAAEEARKVFIDR